MVRIVAAQVRLLYQAIPPASFIVVIAAVLLVAGLLLDGKLNWNNAVA